MDSNISISSFHKDVINVLQRDYFTDAEGYQVRSDKISKNNGVVLHGVAIGNTGDRIMPTFYVEGYVESHTPEAAAHAIAEEYEKYKSEAFELNNSVDELLQWEYVKTRICYKLVGVADNEELLEQAPHRRITNDLALVYYVQVQDGASVQIKSGLVKTWGLGKDAEDVLYDRAQYNTPVLNPARLQSMGEVLSELMDTEGILPEDEFPMYVLSNKSRMFGASALLYGNGEALRNYLQEVERRCGKETKALYILPSSIHEIIIIPDCENVDVAKMAAAVQEINETQVAPTDRLSDHIFYFDKDKGFAQITGVIGQWQQSEMAR